MRKSLVAAIIVFYSLAGLAQQPVKHVVLITIDGFRPDFYLDTAWHATHLRQLMNAGFHANGVNSVFPSVTYPSHTTIITGVQPVKHGVYYNGRFDPTGTVDQNYWMDSSIHVPTIWRVLHDKGLKVASIYWPVSAGAPVDYNIPDIGNRGKTALDANTIPAGFREELRANLFNNAPDWKNEGDQNEARIAAYIIKKDPPVFLDLHLFSVDDAEHHEGRSGELVKKAIANADTAVGIVEDALKEKGIWESTVLIVTGDHGFCDVTKTVNPNVWLKNSGLLNDLKTGDWKAQFNPCGGSAYLYLKDKKDLSVIADVQQILRALPDSTQRLFRIVTRTQMDAVGANPEVAFALTGENGATFGRAATGGDVLPGKGGTHGFFPDFREIQTGFIAFGPGIRAGGVVETMNLRDIAPIVAKLLGFDFPSADGKIPKGMF